jgi:CRISPR-associated protein (TIGR03984 family)
VNDSPGVLRKIRKIPAIIDCEIDTDIKSDLRHWLEDQAKKFRLQWLLLHADDGVVWGRFDGGKLVSSSEIAPTDDSEAYGISPALRAITLQQARLFADHGEILLWRIAEGQWKARLVRDAQDSDAEETWVWRQCFDEPQLLWGTHGKYLEPKFTLLWEGVQGLRHILPLQVPLDPKGKITAAPRLLVRHYLNAEGCARVAASRLCGLAAGQE